MKIDHVGVAVRKLDDSIRFYEESFGLKVLHREEVVSQKVRVAFLGDPGERATVELLEPIGEEGAVARYLASKGPGMHHLAFRTEGIGEDMKRMRLAGRPPIDAAPRPGARGHEVCFLHPKNCDGVLIELISASDRGQ